MHAAPGFARIRASPAWQPFANHAFRALWIAVLFSNIGNWMETVGAQWLLVSRPDSSTLVALVQTADTLPVVLLALPAGVIADLFDRRLLLLATTVFLAAVSVVLTVLTAAGQMSPGLLLALTFLGGAGSGITAPAWQAMVPDLVPRSQLRSASVLGSVSVNVGRAVGPAIAGLLIAQVGVAAVFGFNLASFVLFAAVLLRTRVDRGTAPLGRERFLPALRAGGAYVRWSPYVRSVLIRAALFLLPATAIWALLPIVATGPLHLDSTGYGLLLAALGSGAILGVAVLGRLRARLSEDQLLIVASLAYAAATVTLVLVPNLALALVVLLVAGIAWLVVLSTVNATLQTFLPGWVRARGLAIYVVVLYGAQAIGATVWGLVAQQSGLTPAFLIAGLVMLGGAIVGRRWRLRDVSGLDRTPALAWPDVQLGFEPDDEDGPVLVTTEYSVPSGDAARFVALMADVERSRRRTGASDWHLYRDGTDTTKFLEMFVVPTWETHLRQHGGRLTGTDVAIEARADELATGTPTVRHFFAADSDGAPSALPVEP